MLIKDFILLICLIGKVAFAFQLQSGDLLFQDSNCGRFCDGINDVTVGYGNSYVSHVGMVVGADESSVYVLEATVMGVKEVLLSDFLRSSTDDSGNPRVMVGRLLPKYQKLVPHAIQYARWQVAKPYNSTFMPNDDESFYC